MKRVGKPVFFIVVALIAFFFVTSITGIGTTYGDYKTTYVKGGNDIRWGIDIRGGVDVTFTPPDGVNATETEMKAAEEVIKQRLVSLNITDNEVYTDLNKDRIIVRFPWKSDEEDFDPEAAIKELGETAMLTFREGKETDATGAPAGTTKETIVLEGKDVKEAYAARNSENNEVVVQLKLNDDGKTKFAEATQRLKGKTISIWMDNTMISYPTVEAVITNGEAVITGMQNWEEATSLANKINSGALPFKLQTENFSTINPTMGLGARDAMIIAGGIALLLVCAFIIWKYRVPGAVAAIALFGQVAGMIMSISGYIPFIPSFTLTLPGIAGMVLSIGMGVDANVITSERIKEELAAGKSLDGSIKSGFSNALSAIVDGNLTVVIVAVILMGAFGPPSSIFAKMLSPVLGFLGPATEGAIYSFGYTLLVGVIMNFIMGVTASRLMLRSLSRFKCMRKLSYYGGEKQ